MHLSKSISPSINQDSKQALFPNVGKNLFYITQNRRDGVLETVRLFRATQTAIKRHSKIRGEANPFDPAWEVYFEKRLGVKMESTLRGKRQLLALWKSQNGLCPRCHQRITHLTGWHNHHKVWRSKGGGEQLDNRVLLHPTCHQQLHSQGVTEVEPCPSQGIGKA